MREIIEHLQSGAVVNNNWTIQILKMFMDFKKKWFPFSAEIFIQSIIEYCNRELSFVIGSVQGTEIM